MPQINLLSPIGRMPFGLERGTVIWRLDINSFSWLNKQPCTETTKQVLEDAWDMFMHEGQYAVLRRDSKVEGKVTLDGIFPRYVEAVTFVTEPWQFIYHIVKLKVPEYEKAS